MYNNKKIKNINAIGKSLNKENNCELTIYMNIENEIIKDIAFETENKILNSLYNVINNLILNKSVDNALILSKEDIKNEWGKISEDNLYLFNLIEEALRDGIIYYYRNTEVTSSCAGCDGGCCGDCESHF